ncbi:hypothetical protein [Corynebacterium halotolerans]|uniref:hypothetical protein n=1 Tax=Corynebacterium halotolerans TaxID=225326 RepID=UPI003CF12D3F
MELADRRALTRSLTWRLLLVTVLTFAAGAGFLQFGPLMELGVIMLTLSALCMPVAVLCLAGVALRAPADRLPRWLLLTGAVSSPVLFTWVLLGAPDWVVVALAATVWLLVVGVIAGVALAVLR